MYKQKESYMFTNYFITKKCVAAHSTEQAMYDIRMIENRTQEMCWK